MFLPAMHAVIKQAIFPFIIDLSISLANFGLISGAADVRLPKLIPRAATLPKPHKTYVAITAVLPCKKKWCTWKYMYKCHARTQKVLSEGVLLCNSDNVF